MVTLPRLKNQVPWPVSERLFPARASMNQGESHGALTALSALAHNEETAFDLDTACWNGHDQIRPSEASIRWSYSESIYETSQEHISCR